MSDTPEPEPAPLQLKRPPWDGTGPRFRGLKAKRASQPAPEPQEDANEPQEVSVGQEEAEDAQEGVQSVADQGYQPYDHTVVEVQAYLADNPDQTQYVLDRERAGKNRVTLTGGES